MHQHWRTFGNKDYDNHASYHHLIYMTIGTNCKMCISYVPVVLLRCSTQCFVRHVQDVGIATDDDSTQFGISNR